MKPRTDEGQESRLLDLLKANEWFMRVLRAAREADLPEWYVGAGCIRSLVWDAFHGYRQPTPVSDVDVAYFDPADLSRERDLAAQKVLEGHLAAVPWEANNQASVHLWFAEVFGYPVAPLRSQVEAVASWPETATCVALKWLPDGTFEVIAPYGLEDLLNLRLRRNPTRVTLEEYHRRIRDKKIQERWPLVTIDW